MKRSNMKSNIALQPRCRPEGRLFPRRKVAVKSHLLNGVGDFDMELSLAIQESLKYAQEKEDELRENGLCDTNGPKSDEKSDKCDLSPTPGSRTERPRTCGKSSPSAMASTDWGSEEVGRLKDLLMSQAELIQCQQEEIENKDRQLKALQSSRDALQCRLERMERRMSILKHKEDSHDGQVPVTLDSIGKAAVPTLQVSHKRPNEATSIDFKKRRRRGHKLNFSQRKRHKRQRLVKSASRESTEERDEESDDEEEGETSDESDSGDEDDSRSQDSEDSGSHKEKKDDRDESEDESCIQEERTIDYPIMQTETLYHLYYPKHCSLSPDTKRAQEQTEVETPSWRLKPLTNMYQLEGTENITDEAYFKRHQKFELEEKRRKRWDLQRLRELRISEKLQREREDEIRASQEEVDVETFLPSIHDLKHIEITEAIPVMAFGQPVPYVSPAEFEIPWEITNSGPVASTSRQRVNSVHSRRH